MLKIAKLALLRAATALGLTGRLAESRWRRNRLLILCYHGVSVEDEHLWHPALYMSPWRLERRLAALAETRSNVLPLDDAVRRLYEGTLPPRGVVLTFDDGGYDFYAAALPLLRRFGFPATVYLSTYYVEHKQPVFDTMCSYLLWKGSSRRLEWPELLPAPAVLDRAGREATLRLIHKSVRARRFSGAEKGELLASLAGKLGIDYEALCRKRILHLMNADEVRAAAAAGTDIQLHTHRHRVSRIREVFLREIDDNRRRVELLTGRSATHFCYPSGVCLPDFPNWLRADGVVSATTCEPGLASRQSDPLQLPRLVDTSGLTEVEFRSWTAGAAHLLPRRTRTMDSHALAED